MHIYNIQCKDDPWVYIPLFFRYGKIVSTKAILDKTTNKCKGEAQRDLQVEKVTGEQRFKGQVLVLKWNFKSGEKHAFHEPKITDRLF